MDVAQRSAIEAVKGIVLDEVNVKNLKLVDNEESGLVKRVKADFKKLGPKYGKIMKDLGKAITAMPQKDIAELEKNGSFTFEALPGAPSVTLDDVEVIPEDIPGWLVANDGSVTVALDVTVTPELRNEGIVKYRIQNIRKSSDFEITDKVRVELTSVPAVDDALASFGDYIAAQVLADSIVTVDALEGGDVVRLDIDGTEELNVMARVTR